jgi:hypothetical protein
MSNTFLKELSYLQKELASCFESVIDEGLHQRKEQYKMFDQCKEKRDQIDEFLNVNINKTDYITIDYQDEYNNRIDEAHLFVGRFGYDSNLVKSFALNFSEEEKRHDVLFNKMRKTEIASPYYFNLPSNDVDSNSAELLRKKKFEKEKELNTIKNMVITQKTKNISDLYFNKLYALGLAQPSNYNY